MSEIGKRLLTIQQVADYLGVSIYTVRRRIRAKQLQAFKVGGQYRVSPFALDMMLQEGSSVDLPKEINNLDLV
jgi:excisionase family DNA binding protein